MRYEAFELLFPKAGCYSVAGIHKRQAYSPYSCAILVLSFGLNLALLAYFVVLPASNTVTR